jgi:O-acetyl-ADP-ribose deacetylase (regulator of RNase III)
VTTVKTNSGRLTVELVRGNIANQPGMDAVVNAANASLLPGSGVAGAIHNAAGSGLEEECRGLAPIAPGEAVITTAHGLPNRYVIHCLGPVYGQDEPSDQLLASCYRQALQLAEDKELSSVAFPAISTGVFGYPVAPAARVAFLTLLDVADHLRWVKHTRFVLFTDEDLALHEQVLEELVSQ